MVGSRRSSSLARSFCLSFAGSTPSPVAHPAAVGFPGAAALLRAMGQSSRMSDSAHFRLGRAWLAMAIALGLHVADEAATDFLAVYNPTVTLLRARLPWLPLPTFTFPVWLGGLVAAVTLLLVLTPLAYRGARWLRRVAWPLGVLMTFNGFLHVAGSIYLHRPMPGVYSAPVLIAVSLWLLRAARLARTHSH